jgi:glycosyltransferase involved in cell wall biosynthesis
MIRIQSLNTYKIRNRNAHVVNCMMPEKKVLIIAYYWPPSGGSGVQRWLKFVKYLPQFGWKPFVLTPENPSAPVTDPSLLKDVPAEAVVVKLPIWEPYEVFGKLSRIFSGTKASPVQGGSVNSGLSLFSRFSVWVRGNFFIPDPRKFWVGPAVRFLRDYLEEHNINTLITTGPPHSMHLIGLKLKKQKPALKWIVDMRDPWSEWGFLDSIKAGPRAKAKHKKLEHAVLTKADEVITITPFYVRQFERLSGRTVTLVTNGFDEKDFENFKVMKSDKFRIRHVGVVNEKCDPRPFMNAVAALCDENEEIRKNIEVEFVGEVNAAFQTFVRSNTTLADVTKFTRTVSHEKLMEFYASSAVLLLILTGYKDAEGYMPGKLFEYLATGLPVLGVGPVAGDAADLMLRAKAGEMVESTDHASIKSTLSQFYLCWKVGEAPVNTNQTGYSRKETTRTLVNVLR